MQKLRDLFEKFSPIDDEDWSRFAKQVTRLEVSSKSILLHQGEIENYISFIEKGSVRFFVPKSIDKEVAFAIIFEQELLCAYNSFLTRSLCQYTVETITPTVIWRFTYDTLQHLYGTMPVSNVIGRIASEEIYLSKAARELSMLVKTPQERYEQLFTSRPKLIKEIPLKYIASYIGITPQALSRIRRRIT